MDTTNRYDRVVFLDRDGVINRPPPEGSWVFRWEDFEFADGVLAALRRLHEHGFTAVVVTNQSCVGRGLMALADVDAIHARMAASVAAAGGELAGIYRCPHTDADACSCRKPKPGMLEQAARELGLRPERAFLVGDSERDIQAGRAVGCATILVGEPAAATEADHVASDLADAVAWILERTGAQG